MLSHDDAREALDSFFDDGLIDHILHEVSSGKEASVFCCRGGAAVDGRLLAAKVYRPRQAGAFRNDGVYQAGRMQWAHNSRIRRALKSGSQFGREVAALLWVEHEWTTLRAMREFDILVPQPIACNGRAILLEYIGDDESPAPTLHHATLDRDAVERVIDHLLRMIEWMLDVPLVHGDLSAHNVLWDGERAVIIDVPQAVDPRLNPAGAMLLQRDVRAVCDWAARHGVERPADAIADDLWQRFSLGELG